MSSTSFWCLRSSIMVVEVGVVSAGKGVSSNKETEAVVSIIKVDQQHI